MNKADVVAYLKAWAGRIRMVNALDGKDLSVRNSPPPPLDDVGKVGARLAQALGALALAIELGNGTGISPELAKLLAELGVIDDHS
jgi:hypothetical protein